MYILVHEIQCNFFRRQPSDQIHMDNCFLAGLFDSGNNVRDVADIPIEYIDQRTFRPQCYFQPFFAVNRRNDWRDFRRF